MLTSKENLKEIYKTLFLRLQHCLFTNTHVIFEFVCGWGGVYFWTLSVCRLGNVERGNRNKREILANTY